MTSAAALAALLDPANKMENTAQLREGLTVDAVARRSSPRAPASRSRSSRRRSPTPPTTASQRRQPRGLAVPGDVHVRPGRHRAAGHPDAGRPHRAVARRRRACPSSDRQRDPHDRLDHPARGALRGRLHKVVARHPEPPGSRATRRPSGCCRWTRPRSTATARCTTARSSSSEEALADDNPWNTYVHTGPADRADREPRRRRDRRGDAPRRRPLAVLRHGQPRHRRDGVHRQPTPSTSGPSTQWQQWCAEHPDSGC